MMGVATSPMGGRSGKYIDMKHTSTIDHMVLYYRHIWSPYHKTAPLVHLPGELGLVGCLSRQLFQVMGGSFLDRKNALQLEGEQGEAQNF